MKGRDVVGVGETVAFRIRGIPSDQPAWVAAGLEQHDGAPGLGEPGGQGPAASARADHDVLAIRGAGSVRVHGAGPP